MPSTLAGTQISDTEHGGFLQQAPKTGRTSIGTRHQGRLCVLCRFRVSPNHAYPKPNTPIRTETASGKGSKNRQTIQPHTKDQTTQRGRNKTSNNLKQPLRTFNPSAKNKLKSHLYPQRETQVLLSGSWDGRRRRAFGHGLTARARRRD